VVSVNSGGAIIINGATPTPDSGSAPTSTAPPAVVVVGSSSITANSASGFVIGNQTLFPGSAITTGGEVITLPLPSSTTGPITAEATTTPVFVVGGSTLTENSQSDLVIGSQTLTPGGVLTIGGQVVSLSPTGNAVIVNGADPSTFITETASIVPPPVTSLIIAGQTLTAGGRVTVGGDILSLAPSGTGIVVIGTVTIGGGSSASATTTGKKKNAAGRTSSSFVFVMCQVSFVIMVFWMH
jgi:hypothetical protein